MLQQSSFIVQFRVLIALFYRFLCYTWDYLPETFTLLPEAQPRVIMWMLRVKNPRYNIEICRIKQLAPEIKLWRRITSMGHPVQLSINQTSLNFEWNNGHANSMGNHYFMLIISCAVAKAIRLYPKQTKKQHFLTIYQ